ncbi:hypothetical protein DSO57_1029658 [Entomophthora muscae]|uniref:Uncharacterized protein n=1 Tax=Entomophthora muscae TaxID=34485 RepID=A0ACC2TN56_9FUNG|nr:hypothetical protein DSO57_1029658 [Entomophthora muscae]
MAFTKKSSACSTCRRRKVKCVQTSQAKCVSCLKRKDLCSFEVPTQPKPFRLPPISTLLKLHPDPRCDQLLALLHQQTARWRLHLNVPSLVMSFFDKAGPNNIYFPIDVIFELFAETQEPEILPVILSVMEHHVCPSEASINSFHKSLSSLQEPKYKLLVASVSILPIDSLTLLSKNAFQTNRNI